MGFFDWVRTKAFGKPAQQRDAYAGTYGIGTGGGFAGAAINRLTDSLSTWSGAVNADLDGSLVILRARARQLCADNEHGRRFLNMAATNIVGRSGPALQVRAYKDQRDPNKPTVLDKSANDAIEIHYKRWWKTADIAGRMSYPRMLQVAVKAVARDGEAIFRIIRRRDLPYGIALQMLEADRLDESLNLQLTNGTIRQGVEIDSTGRAIALWLKKAHPGDRYGATPAAERERVPMADIRHLYLPERAEQVRGYTWLHAILRRAHQLHGFNDAAVTAARVGASKVAAIERAEEAPDLTSSMADGQMGGAMQMNLEAGEMFELPPGYKLTSWNPEYPHANFESFVKQAMRGIASGLDVATHNLSGDMTDVNYSSARIAELSEREQWMVLQDWLIDSLVEPIYQEWLASALLRGDITFEISGKSLPADKLAKFSTASRFQGRRWRWVDPAKEIAAAKEGVALGVISRTRIAAEQGEDIDDIFDELGQEAESMEAAGLMPQEAAQPVDPDDDEKQKNNQERTRMMAEISALRSDLLSLHREYTTRGQAQTAPAQEIHIHQAETRVENHLPAPQVGIEIHEREQVVPVIHVAAPEVEVHVEAVMPEQAAPVVEVTVQTPDEIRLASMPARVTTTSVGRDAAGNIKSSTQLEKDL